MNNFTELSLKMNKELTLSERKKGGIYFTPRNVREKIFNYLDSIKFKPQSILEPSFGSGEFVNVARQHYPESKIYGVEKNIKLYNRYTDNNKNDIYKFMC